MKLVFSIILDYSLAAQSLIYNCEPKDKYDCIGLSRKFGKISGFCARRIPSPPMAPIFSNVKFYDENGNLVDDQVLQYWWHNTEDDVNPYPYGYSGKNYEISIHQGHVTINGFETKESNRNRRCLFDN